MKKISKKSIQSHRKLNNYNPVFNFRLHKNKLRCQKVSDLHVKTMPLRKSICHQILERGGFIKNKNKIKHI